MFNSQEKLPDRSGAEPILLPWFLIAYSSLIMFAGSELVRGG